MPDRSWITCSFPTHVIFRYHLPLSTILRDFCVICYWIRFRACQIKSWAQDHKVHIYLECHVCLPPRRNWDPPPPLPNACVPPPPQPKKGGTHSPADKGAGACMVPIRTSEEKLSTLSTLCTGLSFSFSCEYSFPLFSIFHYIELCFKRLYFTCTLYSIQVKHTFCHKFIAMIEKEQFGFYYSIEVISRRYSSENIQ